MTEENELDRLTAALCRLGIVFQPNVPILDPAPFTAQWPAMITQTPQGAIYYVAPDGVTYRVLDVVMKDGVMHASNPPASWAKSRVFRPTGGRKRIYWFTREESREPGEEHLARQWSDAEFLDLKA